MDNSTCQTPAQVTCAHCQRSWASASAPRPRPRSFPSEGAAHYRVVFVAVNTPCRSFFLRAGARVGLPSRGPQSIDGLHGRSTPRRQFLHGDVAPSPQVRGDAPPMDGWRGRMAGPAQGGCPADGRCLSRGRRTPRGSGSPARPRCRPRRPRCGCRHRGGTGPRGPSRRCRHGPWHAPRPAACR